ncbi:MAG: hypothetical protein WCG25_00340 [bacterium]
MFFNDPGQPTLFVILRIKRVFLQFIGVLIFFAVVSFVTVFFIIRLDLGDNEEFNTSLYLFDMVSTTAQRI